MRSRQSIQELAAEHGIKTTKRAFLESRDEKTGDTVTKFVDLPRPRDELIQELRDKGIFS